MELRLSKPIEDLTPALIEFNYAQALAEVKARLVDYKDKVYDDNAIAEAKADRAKLSSVARQINDERIRIGKVYTAPLDKMKCQVDEIIGVIGEVKNTIDIQVKDYEQRQDQAKRESIAIQFELEMAGRELNDIITLDRIWDERWLNVTYKLDKITAEIRKRLEDTQKDLNTIYAYKSNFKSQIFDKYTQTLDLNAALAEDARLTQQAEKIPFVRQTHEPTPATATEPIVRSGEVKQLDFRVWATQEQLNALKAFLKSNNIKYGKVE